jgi:hypothetical protein
MTDDINPLGSETDDINEPPPPGPVPHINGVVVDMTRNTHGAPSTVEFTYQGVDGSHVTFGWAINDPDVLEEVKQTWDAAADDLERARRIIDMSPLGAW